MGSTTTRELRWDTPGSPTLSAVAGAFKNIIRDFLEDCGWTVVFNDDANHKVVLQNNPLFGGSGACIRIVDNGSFSGGNRVASWEVFESVSDIDTGIGPAGSGFVWKDWTNTPAAGAYTLHADERTIYGTTYVGSTNPVLGSSNRACTFVGGDYEPFIPGDPGIIGAAMTAENPGTATNSQVISGLVIVGAPETTSAGVTRDFALNGVLTRVKIMTIGATLAGSYMAGGTGAVPWNATYLPGIAMYPAFLHDGGTIRGKLRGIMIPIHYCRLVSGVGSVHTSTLSRATTSLAALRGSNYNGAAATNDSTVGTIFVERNLSWDDM